MRVVEVMAVSLAGLWLAGCTSAPRVFDDAGSPDGGADTESHSTATEMPGWKLAWATRAGSGIEENPGWTLLELGSSIAPLPDGSVFVVGQVFRSAVFGEDELNETVFSDQMVDWSNGFIARYGPDGALEWARRIGGYGVNVASAHATDVVALADGTAVVIGFHDWEELVLGEGEPNETTLVLEGYRRNAYIARYEEDGDLSWATGIPMSGEVWSASMEGWTVHALADGRLLASGLFKGTAWPGEATEISSDPDDDWDGFLAWFGEDGTAERAVRIGGADMQMYGANNVVPLPDGAVIAATMYELGERFGIGEPNETAMDCPPGDPGTSFCISFARYDASGSLEWAHDLGAKGVGGVGIELLEDGHIGLYANLGLPSDLDGDGVWSDSWGIAVAEYRADDGALEWYEIATVGQYGGPNFKIVAMPDGGMIAAFPFAGTLEFEGTDGDLISMTSSAGADDSFFAAADVALVSFSPEGEIQWMHRMGSEGTDYVLGGAQLGGESLWFTGTYEWDPFVATSGHDDDVELPLDGYTDIFLMRFDTIGPPTE